MAGCGAGGVGGGGWGAAGGGGAVVAVPGGGFLSGMREITAGCADRYHAMVACKLLIVSNMHSNSNICYCCKYGGWSKFTSVRLHVNASATRFKGSPDLE